jgi:hypothetical protein
MSALPQPREPGGGGDIYRDELNFAEFPLASLSTSLPKDQKTLEFTDEIFDKSLNKRIQRKLTITASDKFGLPTAMDDEVILGLIQLSGKSYFKNRRVFFTRYELLKLLNWPDATRSYRRLEESLNRWLGVTLYYEKAWWSKEDLSWVNEGFHLLEHVQILDQERQRRSAKRNGDEAGKSSFAWNETVFNSFKAGYVKQIDFEFYKSLKSAVSKRLYRFLDKRFYRSRRLEFDLRGFCCEHIGLSKKYHTGELKRALKEALSELEAVGYLEAAVPDDRFVQKGRGEWSIVLTRASAQNARLAESSPLVQALIDRGLSAASARRIVARGSREEIEEKISLLDWLVARNDPRVKTRPAGFLYRAITEHFPLPKDFLAARQAQQKPSQKALPITRRVEARSNAPAVANDRLAIDAFWNAIAPEEQNRLEGELARTAPIFLRQSYEEGRKERGPLFQVVRQSIIDEHVRQMLHQQSSAQ